MCLSLSIYVPFLSSYVHLLTAVLKIILEALRLICLHVSRSFPVVSTMPKPTNAKAPALPDAQKVKQTKGLLMRKKSDAIVSAEQARNLTAALRAGWGKSVKGKGKGKGKGKKGKGKGKGEKTWKKADSCVSRMMGQIRMISS